MSLERGHPKNCSLIKPQGINPHLKTSFIFRKKIRANDSPNGQKVAKSGKKSMPAAKTPLSASAEAPSNRLKVEGGHAGREAGSLIAFVIQKPNGPSCGKEGVCLSMPGRLKEPSGARHWRFACVLAKRCYEGIARYRAPCQGIVAVSKLVFQCFSLEYQ
jgi:hypothetical protein